MNKAEVSRKRCAAHQSNETVKINRKKMKLMKAGLADVRNDREGVLYESGGFNM